jgi:uncharacterized protein YukE
MAEDHLAVQIPNYNQAISDLDTCANNLASAHDEMTSTVRANTAVWLDSTSPSAIAWNQANIKLSQLIQDLHKYARDFSSTSSQVAQSMTDAENHNVSLM